MTRTHVTQLASAVGSLHHRGLVHGDICEENIYWVTAETALLNDWSHVKKATDEGSRLSDFQMLSNAVEILTKDTDLANLALTPVLKKPRAEYTSTKKGSTK